MSLPRGILQRLIIEAIVEEARCHPGDTVEGCEDGCIEDERVCMEARIHLAAMVNGRVESVYASPERLAEVAVAAIAPKLADVILQQAEGN